LKGELMKIIKSIDSRGLSYTDELGILKYVDFKECNENWLKFRKRTESLTDEKLESLKVSDKCIGQRDICAKPRYIEFFTKPFTKFEFEDFDYDEYNKLKENILNIGWTMIDLS
jgi:hypothetical protein